MWIRVEVWERKWKESALSILLTTNTISGECEIQSSRAAESFNTSKLESHCTVGYISEWSWGSASEKEEDSRMRKCDSSSALSLGAPRCAV